MEYGSVERVVRSGDAGTRGRGDAGGLSMGCGVEGCGACLLYSASALRLILMIPTATSSPDRLGE